MLFRSSLPDPVPDLPKLKNLEIRFQTLPGGPGLFSSLIFGAALGFRPARMCESMSDNPNRRLSDARVAAGTFARDS